ncbi:MAG TPA: enoyl-CoA hydratase/isomerase family protein [Deltaproteobacteria bacterium]|nr:enoyl-CoA hydratase/isomerase family protein [Deltaproteobacteria bacterium]HOM28116.1 enoyl-CoA hydratase/isomerase family protein [Deltaproteobacteria bacterium]HPP79576.1 enoyl-CoA hydratase/isomerase family protein [Deltaproteobacteria bacterium]
MDRGYGVRLERQGPVAVVTFDRPERKNAFDEHMWGCLEAAVADIRQRPPRAVVVTGAGGRAFSAGFDVNPDNPMVERLARAVERHDRGPAWELITRIRGAVDSLVSIEVPVIAAINGLAYGGGAEIACRCDLRVMDPSGVICFSETRLGLMPDHGGVVGLARLVGASRAADLILTAREVGAEEALSMGLVNRVSAPGKALDEAMDLACAIASNGPRAVRSALSVIRRVADLDALSALELETETAVDLIASGECIHGITAFLSKQKAVFPDPA